MLYHILVIWARPSLNLMGQTSWITDLLVLFRLVTNLTRKPFFLWICLLNLSIKLYGRISWYLILQGCRKKHQAGGLSSVCISLLIGSIDTWGEACNRLTSDGSISSSVDVLQMVLLYCLPVFMRFRSEVMYLVWKSGRIKLSRGLCSSNITSSRGLNAPPISRWQLTENSSEVAIEKSQKDPYVNKMTWIILLYWIH